MAPRRRHGEQRRLRVHVEAPQVETRRVRLSAARVDLVGRRAAQRLGAAHAQHAAPTRRQQAPHPLGRVARQPPQQQPRVVGATRRRRRRLHRSKHLQRLRMQTIIYFIYFYGLKEMRRFLESPNAIIFQVFPNQKI